MRLSISTFDGVSINDSASYIARFMDFGEVGQPRAETKFVERPSNPPLLGYRRMNPRELELGVEALVDYRLNTDKAKKVFDTSTTGSVLKRLVAEDTDAARKTYYLDCIVQEADIEYPELVVKLIAPDPYWTALTATSTTNTNPTTGSTWSVETISNASAFPVISIKPTGTRPTDGDTSRRWVRVINNTDVRFSNYPINLADGEGGNGIAASLLTGLRSDMNDLRVFVDGTQVNRWLATEGGASRKHIWTNLNLEPLIAFTTANSTANSGLTDIGLAKTRPNEKAIAEMPQRGQFTLEGEMFTYQGKDEKRRVLKNVKRAVMNTSANHHAASVGGSRVQHRILMTYGNSAFNTTGPNTDDANDFAPIFNLDSNGSTWYYDNFSTRRGTNSAEWNNSEKANRPIDDTGTYTGDNGGTSRIATELGMRIAGELDDGQYRATQADLFWTLYCPAGVNSVCAVGEKWMSSTKWPNKAELVYSQDGKTWTQQWNDTKPNAAQAWRKAPLAVSNLHNLNASPQWIGFRFKGGQPGGSVQEKSLFEMASAVVTFISASLPTVEILGQNAEYEVKSTITNQTTGEAFKLNVNTSVNETIIVDTEKRLVYADGENINYIGGLELLGTVRDQWMTLAPSQVNTIRYDDVGTGNVTVAFSARDRSN